MVDPVFLIWLFGPTICVVVLACVLSVFKPPKKKYWGPGESWWPEEREW